ncbi:MAG TPA: bifunctional precorrin-2 dehydrogenase/sirohydrochlorin ferrochelatase [Acidimicrobiales bacterium]|jgi:siroheme synthase-like protein|nr:bifunctional precorrin-2 dehydrogenase/sirohydrochlorin ferrochelatase [Acidimicrobiales bacterium]
MGAPTLDPPRVLPVALVLEGRRCLVVGGGRRAARRVAELASAGADVRVVAPTLADEVRALVRTAPTVAWHARRFEPGDLDGVHLVVAATGDPSVDQRVFELADARGTWVHAPDDPARCSVYAMALVRRGPVTVAVSTAGTSPALASYLRGWLDARLDGALGDVAGLLAGVRRELLGAGRSTEGRAWGDVVDDELVAMVAAGSTEAATARVRDAVLPVRAEP